MYIDEFDHDSPLLIIVTKSEQRAITTDEAADLVARGAVYRGDCPATRRWLTRTARARQRALEGR